MKNDNSTGKDREFYEMGKKIFDRIPRITQAVPQIPQTHSSNRQWIGLTEEEIERMEVDAGIVTWLKKSYDPVDKRYYDLPTGEGMEGDGISLRQFASLICARLKELNA